MGRLRRPNSVKSSGLNCESRARLARENAPRARRRLPRWDRGSNDVRFAVNRIEAPWTRLAVSTVNRASAGVHDSLERREDSSRAVGADREERIERYVVKRYGSATCGSRVSRPQTADPRRARKACRRGPGRDILQASASRSPSASLMSPAGDEKARKASIVEAARYEFQSRAASDASRAPAEQNVRNNPPRAPLFFFFWPRRDELASKGKRGPLDERPVRVCREDAGRGDGSRRREVRGGVDPARGGSRHRAAAGERRTNLPRRTGEMRRGTGPRAGNSAERAESL